MEHLCKGSFFSRNINQLRRFDKKDVVEDNPKQSQNQERLDPSEKTCTKPKKQKNKQVACTPASYTEQEPLSPWH